ncbi:unnamed protein product [Xylocopa violacea]|uniref:Niemann-Pick C1 N-terminal domain-containing protein n=1 Tax=Xylocopa violacea TaxID=135666 RepID=A0ABP1NWV4_XYLVO
MIDIYLDITYSDIVWYGDCGLSDKGLPRTCVSKQCRAVPLNNKAVETLLARWCPQYFEGTDESPPLCCDAVNVATLVEKLSIVEDIFGGCPTCLKNVFKLLCDLTCSPKQSEFLNVTKTNKDEEYGEYVEEIQAYVAEEYLNGTYNSCKDVFTGFGNLAMDLACGDNGDSICTAKLWYKGDPDTTNFRIMNFGVTLITKDKS